MKNTKSTQLAKVAAFVFACGLCATASATVVKGVSLGAQDAVNEFNSMNNGKGLVFSFERVSGHAELFKIYNAGNQFIDLSTYSYGTGISGGKYFTSIGAAYNTTVSDGGNAFNANSGYGTGKLNYVYNYQYGQHVSQTAYKASSLPETTLSVGAAYIYAAYVTQGKYQDIFSWYTSQNTPAHNAWTILTYNDDRRVQGNKNGSMGETIWKSYGNNTYLQSLLNINNDINYWLSPYDPDKLYSEIGYYSVFTMNAWDTDGKIMRNILVLADMSPTAVPEPETYAMMLAGLALMGGVARRRSRKQ
jgi:hypothetical protein